MPQQPQQSQQSSFIQSFQMAKWVTQFSALTWMIWIRPDLGFRMVSPIRIIPVTVILIVVSDLAMPGSPDARPVDLLVFALLTLGMGIFQRIKGWIKFEQKIRQHSYYMGTSVLDVPLLPAFFRRSRRIERFVDPIVCTIIGLALFHFSRALSMWLIFSGLSLRMYEHTIFQRNREMSLDIIDAMNVSEQQSQIVEEFEATSAWHKHRDATGVPTGLGDDLERQIKISIKHRKVKPNKPTIDI
jgi:hypothetical protein